MDKSEVPRFYGPRCTTNTKIHSAIHPFRRGKSST